ncbi:hypothetical protein ABTM14_19820, partial [Acinetobacter baumannii]
VSAGAFSSMVFVLWLGARAVIDGSMTAGTLGAFIIYAVLAAVGIGVLAEVWGEIMRAAGATTRLIELLSAVPAIRPPVDPEPLPEAR